MDINFSTPNWIKAGWCLILISIAAILSTPHVDASHRRTGGTRLHQNKMHYSDNANHGANDEEYCVVSHSPYYISNATALAKVDYAFFNTGTPRWDGTQSGNNTPDWRVELWGMSLPCSSYTPTELEAIEIEIHVYKVTSCPDNYSCVGHFDAIQYIPPPNSGIPIHYDYKYEWIYMDYDNMWVNPDDNSSRTINHEMGHVLGLHDGGGSNDCVAYKPSLMHNTWYGCTYNGIVPTTFDLNSVRAGSSGY